MAVAAAADRIGHARIGSKGPGIADDRFAALPHLGLRRADVIVHARVIGRDLCQRLQARQPRGMVPRIAVQDLAPSPDLAQGGFHHDLLHLVLADVARRRIGVPEGMTAQHTVLIVGRLAAAVGADH